MNGLRRLAAIACVVVVPSMLTARQGFSEGGRWKNYTDMTSVRAVGVFHDTLWAASEGGLFSYVPTANRFERFTNSEGLSTVDLTALTIDPHGRIWTGGADGALHLYEPSTGRWREIRAIKDSPRIQKGVKTFLVHGDSLFIGTDFGISVFHLGRFEFGDTYASFGFQTQAPVNALLIHKNHIWAATDLGVVTAPLNAPNLSSPTAWRRYDSFDGLPANRALSVAAFRDTIIVGTTNGVAAFGDDTFQPVVATAGKNVTAVAVRQDDAVFLWNQSTSYTLASASHVFAPWQIVASNPEGTASSIVLHQSSSMIWVGTRFKGIARWTGSSWSYAVPNGPGSNLFSNLVVDNVGALWAASGISGRGRGFYRYDPSAPDGSRWMSFAVATHPILRSNDYYRVSLGADSSVWVSSWGYGVAEVVGGTVRRRLDHSTVPAFAGSVPHDPSYVVIGGVGVDPKANTWFVNRTAINGKHLVRISGDNAVRYVTSPSSGMFTALAIDRNGTIWLANSEPAIKLPTGLFYYSPDSLVAGTRASGGWGVMTTADGLPSTMSNVVLSLAIDNEGRVCVGTDLGLVIVTDPLNPKTQRISSFPLRGQTIQTIAVDGINNKWVGTKEGVIVVNPDGSQVLAQYSVLTTNGKLVDNDVRSIAIDQKRGIVYVGTEKGLSSLEIDVIQTMRTFTSLELGPNPYVIPSEYRLTIRNLVPETAIKILTVTGSLVKEFRAQGGGRAFWDGRDSEGLFVPSGVYFVVAFAENGNQIGTGKVAVVRR